MKKDIGMSGATLRIHQLEKILSEQERQYTEAIKLIDVLKDRCTSLLDENEKLLKELSNMNKS